MDASVSRGGTGSPEIPSGGPNESAPDGVAAETLKKERVRLALVKLSVDVEQKTNPAERQSVIQQGIHYMHPDDLDEMELQLNAGTEVPEIFKRSLEMQAAIDGIQQKRAKLRKEFEQAQASASETPPNAPPKTPTAPASAKKDPWLPQSVDPRQWSERQIATVATITLGAAGLYALWSWWRRDKNETSLGGGERHGFFRSMFFWVPVLGLAAVGVYAGHKALMTIDGYKKTVEDWKREAKLWAKKAKDALPVIGNEGAKYGLEKEDFQKAKTIYRTKGEQGRAEIAAIFGLKNGEKKEGFELFMTDMKERYKIEKRANGVNYVRASVAIENYEEEMAVSLQEFERWMKDHAGEIAAGALLATVVAARLNILKTILASGVSAVKKAAQLSLAMAKWGIKHPFVSFLLIGGSFVALKKMNDKVFLPQNLHELSKACNGVEGAQIAEGSIENFDHGALSAVQSTVKKVGVIGENVSQWINEQLQSLLGSLKENVPELIALSPEEIIAKNNCACMQALREHLTTRLSGVRSNRDRADTQEGSKCEIALESLDVFEAAFLSSHCTDEDKNNLSPDTLMRLHTALADLKIDVQEKDGVITWKSPDMPEAFDLCVSPSITNRAQFKLKSERLRHGESALTYILENALDQFRDMEQRAMNNGERLVDNKPVAMVVGNFLYIFEDWKNTKNYFMVPLDIALDAIGMENPLGGMHGSRNWTEWGANMSTGLVTCTMFSLNLTWLTKLKRFAMGGGTLRTSRISKIIWSVTPVLSQIELAKNIYGTVHDARVIGQFGYLDGRRMNILLHDAKIRPEWIQMLESGNESRIKRAVLLMGKSLEQGKTIEEIRQAAEQHVIDKLKKASSRQWRQVPANLRRSGGKFWEWHRAFGKKEVGEVDAADIYKKLKEAYAPTKVAPSVNAYNPGSWSETLKASQKAQDALTRSGIALEQKLIQSLEESPAFARVLLQHLETAPDPAKLLQALNGAVSKVENTAVVAEVMSSQRGLAKVLKVMESGGDVASAFAKTNRALSALKLVGKSVPVVLDTFVIFGTVAEIMETSADIERMKKAGATPERIRLAEQRYNFHAAQIGVSGIGLGTGVLAIAGIGGVVATPVALATLPISAVLFGAYEGHKWKEAQVRSADDWAKEHDLVTLLADTRTYTVGERVGHAWELLAPEWYEYALGPLYHMRMMNKIASGSMKSDVANLMEKISTVDRKKIEAIVAHTTTIRIPEKVMGHDGQPRDLTAEEATECQGALRRYVDTKVSFILAQSQDATHAIKAYGDVTELLENAEAAALLARDRPQLEKELHQLEDKIDTLSQERAAKIRTILTEKDPVEQAKRYGKQLREQQIDGMYVELLKQVVTDDGDRAAAQGRLEQPLNALLLSNVQNAYTNFCMRCEEDKLRSYFAGTDRGILYGTYDAVHITKLYGMEKVRELAQKRSTELAKRMLDKAHTPSANDILEFRAAIQEATRDAERLLSNPADMWQSISTADADRLTYGHAARERLPDDQRQKLLAGEALMRRINANANGSYFTKQFGWIGNKFLYMNFSPEEGIWKVGLMNMKDMHDPRTFTTSMWLGTAKYNQLIADLDAINHGKQPSQ